MHQTRLLDCDASVRMNYGEGGVGGGGLPVADQVISDKRAVLTTQILTSTHIVLWKYHLKPHHQKWYFWHFVCKKYGFSENQLTESLMCWNVSWTEYQKLLHPGGLCQTPGQNTHAGYALEGSVIHFLVRLSMLLCSWGTVKHLVRLSMLVCTWGLCQTPDQTIHAGMHLLALSDTWSDYSCWYALEGSVRHLLVRLFMLVCTWGFCQTPGQTLHAGIHLLALSVTSRSDYSCWYALEGSVRHLVRLYMLVYTYWLCQSPPGQTIHAGMALIAVRHLLVRLSMLVCT